MKPRIFSGAFALVTAVMFAGSTPAVAADSDGLTMKLRPAKAAKAHVVAARAKTAVVVKQARTEKMPAKLPPKVVARNLTPPSALTPVAQHAILKVELAAVNAPETTLAETAGLVIERNYVVVPFDVIASVGMHRGEPAFFVGPLRVHATLVDFNFVSNQALLRTDAPFAESMNLGSIRQQWPHTDEAIVASQGIGGQKFNGKVHEVSNDGVVSRFNVPSPFSAQNVESFAFDQSGNLVGIRSREQDDYSPSNYTYNLVSRAMQKQPASTQGMMVKLHQQWVDLQTKWAEALIQDASRLRMQQWQVGLGTKLLKCQPLRTRVADRNLASVVNRAEGQTCANRASTKVDIDYQPGVETVAGVGSLRGAVDGEKFNSLTHEMALSFFSPFDSDIQAVSLFTTPACEESAARSRSGQELRIHFCTSSIKGETGLNDSVFFVTTRQPAGEGFAFSGVRLKGFDQTNSKALVWAVMESFKRLK